MTTEEKRVKLAEYRKESPRCSFIKKDGTRCKGIASNKTGKCPSHSGFIPQLARKRVDLTVSNDFMSIKKFLCQVAMDLKRGKITPSRANSLSNTARVLIEIEEKLVLDTKIEELSTMLEGFKNADYAELQNMGALESEFDKQ